MRIGLHGLGALAPWQSLVAALGDSIEVVALDGARCQAIVVCGSSGSDERADAAVLAFARGGGPVLGLGEGFQALCALGLLPGRVSAPGEDEGEPARAHVRVEGRATPFTSAIPAGRVMSFDDASAVGLRFDIGEPETLEARGQVVFRYCDSAGGDPITPTSDVRSGPLSRLRASSDTRDSSQLRLASVPLIAPKVRARAIAGICSETGNVVGFLAAAAAVEALGAQLLGSLRMHLRSKR
jgi:hypothetical protein